MTSFFRIANARENNLKGVSLEVPHYQFIVVTGVSGSGKSSLAFDVIAAEGQRRFLETYSSFSRLFMGKMNRPEVDVIENLPPVITLTQKTIGNNIRSTVGTMSDLYDLSRLLFARLGQAREGQKLSRALFSFNSPLGACPACKGIGLEEAISAGKLVAWPEKSLREGCLAPSLPNGYIMYSQVTLEVLDQVCRAHGFNVDIPWNTLTEEQKAVILYGSQRVKVPFGKHPLENRLKWTGITAKPREEGYYRGLVPIMSEILQRDRNESILRYAVSAPCSSCGGKRLNADALQVTVHGRSIDALAAMPLCDLAGWIKARAWLPTEQAVGKAISQKMIRQLDLFSYLGLAHLSMDRQASSLNAGEAQRLRLINQLSAELSHVLYVFDEPSIGLHAAEASQLVQICKALVRNANTVMVVEHDEAVIRQADWIIDMGPGPGKRGGEILFNGPLKSFLQNQKLKGVSPTWEMLHDQVRQKAIPGPAVDNALWIKVTDNALPGNTLQQAFKLGALNVVSGVSGSGKNSLVHGLLEEAVKEKLKGKGTVFTRGNFLVTGLEHIDKLVVIDQSPIGRTPRSNPATYTAWSDKLRDLFASLDDAKKLGLKKSHFSFNTAGGRCDQCLGAGQQQIGMHFLGNVSVICPLCNGKRFHEDVLQVRYKDKDISQILEMSVDQAVDFFSDQKQMLKQLLLMQQIGLGYLSLGQPSTTLSGGEAQRVKLAAELQSSATGRTMYVLDEPSTGLHPSDIKCLLDTFQVLLDRGNTVVCIEQDWDVIRQAGHWIELGKPTTQAGVEIHQRRPDCPIRLQGVKTFLLQDITVSFPRNRLSVVTGVSGSGKTSLAFHTLFAEAQSRYSESFSTYTRSLIQQANPARFEEVSGIGPAVAIARKHLSFSARSTLGTITGIYDHFRLLYARLAFLNGLNLSARHFSFNHQLGACPRCDGLGSITRCDPALLITHPGKSLLDGAMSGHKAGLYYGDPHGQYVAVLQEVGRQLGLDFSLPYQELGPEARQLALHGTGERLYVLAWAFKNKTRSGLHQMESSWKGFCELIEDEFRRKHLNKYTRDIEALLLPQACDQCHGSRLKPELLAISFMGKNIAELSGMTVAGCLDFLAKEGDVSPGESAVIQEVIPPVREMLLNLKELGLSYLTIDRPAASLSGGEAQRVRLAAALSAGLFGVTYILDEPTIGLHARDVIPLTRMIKALVAKGNTVIAVEHDERFIRQADYIVEMGPGPGREGGRLVATGTLQEIIDCQESATGACLRSPIQEQPKQRNLRLGAFGVRGACLHNLKHIDLQFVAGGIIAVTGISGSGKSSLVSGVLAASARAQRPVACTEVFGLEQFDKVIELNQQLGQHALASVATYAGLMDLIRDLFARTKEAVLSGLGKSAFSYLTKEGKCPACDGYGMQKTSMDFMSDVWTVCELCHGSRYRPEPLRCLLNDKNIADVLRMTVKEAMQFFQDEKTLANIFSLLVAVGIGHLQLGQGLNAISGGESQRLKLARTLAQQKKGAVLFLFDEPSTGLHPEDIRRLARLFNQLVDMGHTLLFTEHNTQLISMANQLIELGPGSGPSGGTLVQNIIT